MKIWVIRLMKTFVPQEENGVESIIIQAILRKCSSVGVDENDDSEYALGVLGGVDNPDNGSISVKIDGVQVTMTICSGASCNALDRKLWDYLKANEAQASKATKKLYCHGSKQPLRVAGTFTAVALVGNRLLNEANLLLYRLRDMPFWGQL